MQATCDQCRKPKSELCFYHLVSSNRQPVARCISCRLRRVTQDYVRLKHASPDEAREKSLERLYNYRKSLADGGIGHFADEDYNFAREAIMNARTNQQQMSSETPQVNQPSTDMQANADAGTANEAPSPTSNQNANVHHLRDGIPTPQRESESASRYTPNHHRAATPVTPTFPVPQSVASAQGPNAPSARDLVPNANVVLSSNPSPAITSHPQPQVPHPPVPTHGPSVSNETFRWPQDWRRILQILEHLEDGMLNLHITIRAHLANGPPYPQLASGRDWVWEAMQQTHDSVLLETAMDLGWEDVRPGDGQDESEEKR